MSRPPTPLPGAVLVRVAERLCAPHTAQRVLLPIVADLQFEWQHATSASGRLWVRLRGACAFTRTLVPAVSSAAVDHLRRNAWGTNPEECHTARRLLAWSLLASLAATALSVAAMTPAFAGRDLGPLTAVLMLPSVLTTAFPAGCLFGALVAGRGSSASIWRPLLGIAGLLALITFGMAGWMTPRANQAFRERVFAASRPHAALPLPGDRELTIVELGAHTTRLRQTGDTRAADRFVVEWHKKPAVAALCLVMALWGATLSRVGRWWLRIGLCPLLLQTAFILLRLGEQAADAHRLAPAVGIWGPVSTMLALALLLSRWRRSVRAVA